MTTIPAVGGTTMKSLRLLLSMVALLLTVCTLNLTACSSSPRGPVDPTGSAEKDRIALDKLRTDFAAAFNANDPAGVANLYSSDAVLMPEASQLSKVALQSNNISRMDSISSP
jgi:hypothetical protein